MTFFQKLKLKKLLKRTQSLHDKKERGANVDARNEIKAQMDLARFYDQYRYYVAFPKAELFAKEYYRAAANLGSKEAQYIFGERRLEEGKFWQEWSNGINGRPIHQQEAKNAFDEAFLYLSKAEENGYSLAKRLKGLAYIHGWGLPVDKDKGFQMVVQSIQEAGAWDRSNQILTELGLNTPEFFSAIMSLREKK